jgi:hypothetical protein
MGARHVLYACGIVAALSLIAPASAQDRPEDYRIALKANCSKELKTICKGVPDGRGRVLACLYSRENKLSARCGETVAASLERLGEALGALANVRRVCGPDARRLCTGVVPGDGNLISCLTTGRRSVSSECNATLDSAFLRP